MTDFVHLHLHTEYSLLDGAIRIKNVFKTAKEKGMKAVAITDHGNMFGTLQFAKEAKANGMKAIIGCEMYMCDDYTVKSGKGETEHLVLLCKNKIGYKNLIKMVSIAYVDGFYYKPRIDYKLLKEHHEGLICLSACLAGRINKKLLNDDYDGAKKDALMLKDIFGEDFYLEVQDHGLLEDKHNIPLIMKLSRETGIETVATNDCHYQEREDAESQDVVMCISMKKTYDDPNRLKMESDQLYMKTGDEMAQLFSYLPEAIENTVKICDKVTEEVFDIDSHGDPVRDNSLIPGYTPDNGQTCYDYLKDMALKGLKDRYPVITQEIQERFDYELDVISSMGFCDYYLIVWDFINYARSVGIPVGAGRGSGVSSIIAYSIGITDVDPMKYNLLFERFLNRERVSMPDFDVDISDARRGEVVEYVRKKYGADKVAQIVTFGTLKAKQAIKDVARVYKIPYSDVDKITKLMDGTSTIPMCLGFKPDKDGVYHTVQEIKDIYDNDPTLHKVIDLAMKVENLPRNTSMHAAGVVICAKVISDNIPLQRNGEDITTQFNMIEVEQLGMLKMDFLGLRTLTDIQMAEQFVMEDYGRELDFHKLGYEDQEAYGLIGSGETDAVFQLESPGMKKFMRDLKPTTFEDIIAGISLYRPGPMDSIPQYIFNKHHPEQITYSTPLLEPILSNSYGILIYQEQVMQVCQQLGGFSLGHADIVRKAMGKKKVDVMAKQKPIFINGGINDHTGAKVDGAVKRGVPEDVAAEIFDTMAKFAKYAFNKSHAAAYAVLAYQSAFLKRYYPIQFIASILNNRIDKQEELSKYLSYLKSKNIPVYQPDINKSVEIFKTENKTGIRFGLVGLKNVGYNVIEDIVAERNENGAFTSFEDFIVRCAKININSRMIESMIFAGVFDCFGHKRSQLMRVYADAMEKAVAMQKQKDSAQLNFFSSLFDGEEKLTIKYPEMEEYPALYKLNKEKEVLGVYITGHPLEDHKAMFESCTFSALALQNFEMDEDGNKSYPDVEDGLRVTLGGIIVAVDKLQTKSGQVMEFVKIEDLYGVIECILFPKTYEKYKSVPETDAIVTIVGRIQKRDGEEPKILVESMARTDTEKKPETEEIVKNDDTEYLGLIFTPEKENLVDACLEILENYPGDDPVIIAKGGKKYKAGISVRKCEGLKAELYEVLSEKEVIFFKMQNKNASK